MPDHFADRFLETVTPQPGDPTFPILKTHLLIEDVLRTYLEHIAHNDAPIRKAKLTFAQTLQIARAFCPNVTQDHWIWKAMGDLNKFRNDLSHNLEPEELAVRTNEFASSIITAIGRPVPKSLTSAEYAEYLTKAKEDGRETYRKFYKIDIALVGLYSAVLGVLQFNEQGVPTSPPRKT
jgi:hypothetical protein